MTRLEQIKQEVEAKGFILVSAEGYKNLQSIIKVQCKNGHITEVSFEDFRKVSFICPECDKIKCFKNPAAVPAKQGYRIIAFDQATEHFGLSVYDNGQLMFFNLYTFVGSVNSRLAQIKKFVEDIVIGQWRPDYIVMEDIQYQYGAVVTYKILAMLLGVLETICYEKGIKYEVVSPNVWRKYAGTCGKTRQEEKKLSVAVIKEKYGVKVNDDVAEAILIGKYATMIKKEASIELAFGKR